ncbi:hypothetical protein AVV30_gp056 [Vibrio phage phi 1]|uniref:Uncharacterized protein n=1 Tax=Vibrio phage phi 1 TaxID=1589297 RepID=A0A0B5HAG4_9CAUD|nr:hypothetical protein AVV30_gp056 [Vibrio phage phi 1]AJF40714.1 hypothetical protein SBVP1_0056 [Vibrio phage phi 1]
MKLLPTYYHSLDITKDVIYFNHEVHAITIELYLDNYWTLIRPTNKTQFNCLSNYTRIKPNEIT